MSKEESIDEMVARRNKRILKLFTNLGYNIRLVGDVQKPSIVLDEMVVLSCYAKNFELHFTKEPFSNEIVKSFKLNSDIEVSNLELQEAIELGSHRPVYKIRLTGTEMFLVGYNYLNSEDAIGRYPVFAKHKPKVYFDKEYTIRLAENLAEEEYSIEIV